MAERRACRDNEQTTVDLLFALLRGKADPNRRRVDKSTPLHEAAKANHSHARTPSELQTVVDVELYTHAKHTRAVRRVCRVCDENSSV